MSLAAAGCAPTEPPARSPRAVALPLAGAPDPAPGAALSRRSAVPPTDEVWTRCYDAFQPTDDPASDLDRLTAACGAPAGLVPVTPVQVGALQTGRDAPERFGFRARAGRCYRVFSVGEAAVADLDVAIGDPHGRLVAADASPERWTVVPPRGPLCVPRNGVYELQVAVVAGQGRYLLQVWGD